ncbi:MAG: glucose-1-phosphate thymidylyltransferase [Caulobacteraceae bacterium]|nr:glucose-1-phosphate thymidylyltransferase [Caulobacteraceae bacterium]
MRGLILAGGSGTRLRPITHTGAKQLVPVANRPIIFYVIDCLAAAGIKEIGVVVSHETSAEIQSTVGDGSNWDVSITYITQSRPGGLAHAVLESKDFLGTDDFCMFLGDNLVGDQMLATALRFDADKSVSASLLLKEVPNPTAYGVAEVDRSGRIVGLEEKPKHPKSDLALVGIYFFRHDIFDAIAKIGPSRRGELEITDAINVLIRDGKRVEFSVLGSWWLDTGKKDDLILANSTVLDDRARRSVLGSVDSISSISGRVTIDAGALVEGSIIRGPAAIGPYSIIKNSYVGPYTSIDSGASIINSRVENSIIMQGSEVVGANIADSVLGRRVSVRPAMQKLSKSLCLMVGDDCKIEIPEE